MTTQAARIAGYYTAIMICLTVIGLLFLSCSTGPQVLYPREVLFEQRIAPRPGFKGLTNQVCTEKAPRSGRCTRFDTFDYDLNDVAVRQKLRELEFVCNVAGHRFRIDRDRPGLTENSCVGWWIFCKVQESDFIDLSTPAGYQRALDADTFCAAKDSFLGSMMFIPAELR